MLRAKRETASQELEALVRQQWKIMFAKKLQKSLKRYMIHDAMIPVLHVEGCRTCPGSIVVGDRHHLCRVTVAFHLSLFFLLSLVSAELF
jgi:hypothetical protein